jgi:hypothetical protein
LTEAVKAITVIREDSFIYNLMGMGTGLEI